MQEAVTAMAAMNGTVVMGRPLRVREANKVAQCRGTKWVWCAHV